MYVFFSVGEPSGDQHAAHLISELRRHHPRLKTAGFGGPLMERTGCELLFRMTDLAVMGLLSVLPALLKFFRLYKQAKVSFDACRPDAVVLIDFPGFNWHIARAAKKRGIPVYYYMPPQLWAWAPWRIRKVRRSVDLILSGLPFERDWYAARGVAVEYVGHPFFDEVADHPLDENFIAERKPLRCASRPVGILPGSRRAELDRNWPAMMRVMHNLTALHPNIVFRVACYRESHREQLEQAYRASAATFPIEFCVGKTPEIIQMADCCLMVSGSVSLELLARHTPAVVMYRGGPFTRTLSKIFLTCKYISLPNLIADRLVMPEFFYSGDSSSAVSEVTQLLDGWLSDANLLARKRRELELLADEVGERGGTARAAEVIAKRLAETPRLRIAA